MKANKFVKKCGPYDVHSYSQDMRGVRLQVYPAFPEYNSTGGEGIAEEWLEEPRWALHRYKGDGGGPGIFTCIALGKELAKFLNQSYSIEQVKEWEDTNQLALKATEGLPSNTGTAGLMFALGEVKEAQKAIEKKLNDTELAIKEARQEVAREIEGFLQMHLYARPDNPTATIKFSDWMKLREVLQKVSTEGAFKRRRIKPHQKRLPMPSVSAVYSDRKGQRLSRKPHRGWRRVL